MESEGVDHRLAAILSADVVGYSRLMAEDEAATVRTLSDYREEIGLLVRQHRGRVVDTAGDSLLAEFPTALEAVRSAVEIQRVIQVRNADLSPERRMQFRIGVHLGDVMVEGERIYGDGINIAARLEGMAEAGGICISAEVHGQVRHKLDLEYEDLGEQQVKNIPDPVRVYRVQPRSELEEPTRPPAAKRKRPGRLRAALVATAAIVLLIGVGLWVSWPRPLGLLVDFYGLSGPPVHPPLPDKPSIVVLPFTNMSGDPEQEYFSDGITEELTSDLAQIPELFVIARNSAFTYKQRAVNVEEVGRELGVRYVVEGSVRRSADRVRITVQLIDATTGFHLWSEQYDRELADIFAVQSEISRKLVGALSSEIHQAMLERMGRRFTSDLVAYDLDLKATSHYRRFTREDNLEARRLLERAIERDPNFALAVGLLGATYFVEYTALWNLDEALMERAEELARRALALDPTTPSGYGVLAGVQAYAGRLDEALAAAERATTLAPNLEIPHLMLALISLKQGRVVAALQSLDRALRLNPRGTSVAWVIGAWVNLTAGRTEQAVEMLERERAANPDTINARVPLAAIYEGEGRHDEAREVVREILRVNPQLTVEAAIRPTALSAARAPEFTENLRKAGLPDQAPATQDFTVPGFGSAPAVAVLAFDNLSGDPEQEYFADGLAEELITRLSSRRLFPVIARNSSFAYKGQAVDVKQVSRELGARYLVEGSVRRAEERVRISVQAIDATTGHHVWAETYDRELQDVFALQDEITESIVASMYPKLYQSEWKRAARRDPRALGTYDLNQRAWWHFSQFTADHNAKARSLFEQAIELDPSNGRSFAGLAFTHYNDIQYQWTSSPARSIAELERTARKGAALGSELAIGQLALAFAHQITGRRNEMIAAVERAIELNPSFTLAHAMLGLCLGQTGKPDEALPHLEKAMRLSPRDSMTWLFTYGVAASHFGARRYEDAVAWAQRSLQQKPDYVFAWGILAASQAQLGRTDEARTAFEEMLRQQPELGVTALARFFSHADADWFERYADGLRMAGLKE